MTKRDDDLKLASPDEAPEGALLVAMNITRLRSQKGWSEEMLATNAGIDAAVLAKHLSGVDTPPLEILWKVANALRVPVATLLQPLRRGL